MTTLLRNLTSLMLVFSAACAGAQFATLEATARANPSLANRMNLSQAYINRGDLTAASQLLQQIVATDPSSAVAWNNLCVTQILQLDLNDALPSCNRSSALAPELALARNNTLWARQEIQREQDALTREETVAPANRDREFFLAQGFHHMHLGQYDSAIRSWERMILINSHDAVAANNIGTALMQERRPQEAKAWFENAAHWDPSLEIARNNIAWAEAESSRQRR